MLIAEAAAGKAAFDDSFRREIRKVLPKGELKILPSDSPLYQMPYRISAVGYTDLVKASEPDLNTPRLEGIAINGQLAVIYSAFSLSNGWEQLTFAYNRGCLPGDSLRLGVNIFAYALTH